MELFFCTPLGQEQSLVSWQLLEKDPAPPRPPFGRVQICAHWTHEGAWLEGAGRRQDWVMPGWPVAPQSRASPPDPGHWTSFLFPAPK